MIDVVRHQKAGGLGTQPRVGHPPQGRATEAKQVGKPVFLLRREGAVEEGQGGDVGHAVPKQASAADAVECGVPRHPRRERLAAGGREQNRQREVQKRNDALIRLGNDIRNKIFKRN